MSTATERLCQALHSGRPLDEPLHQLVLETNSRAAGVWLLCDGHLELIGFAAVDDMPLDVAIGFRETTRRVSLTHNQLGIVRAVNTASPTLAQRDPRETGLTGSASWISRFDAQTSLAVPIRVPATNTIVGAVAVSTAEILHPEHPFWERIVELAAELGSALPSRAPSSPPASS